MFCRTKKSIGSIFGGYSAHRESEISHVSIRKEADLRSMKGEDCDKITHTKSASSDKISERNSMAFVKANI